MWISRYGGIYLSDDPPDHTVTAVYETLFIPAPPLPLLSSSCFSSYK